MKKIYHTYIVILCFVGYCYGEVRILDISQQVPSNLHKLSIGDSIDLKLFRYRDGCYGRMAFERDATALNVTTSGQVYTFSNLPQYYVVDVSDSTTDYAVIQGVPEPATILMMGLGFYSVRRGQRTVPTSSR